MGHLLADMVEWMTGLPAPWAYALILVIAYGENVMPPIPGDMIVVFGGYMVGLGKLDLLPVILLATAGGSLGFMTMYYFGRKLGDAILQSDRFRWLPRTRIQTVRVKLQNRGFGLVAANRFLSGLRSVISLTVGMAHMNVGKTFVYSTLSSLVWTALLTVSGYYVGENWELVSEYLRAYGWVVITLLVLFGLFQWRSYSAARRNTRPS
jgi:membrane protein DedA with SNARE-associated domain